MVGSLLAGTDETPGRGLSLSGPLLQELSRHGLGRRDGARLGRPLLPAGHQGHAQARARGHRGAGALQGAGRRTCCISSPAACAPRWAMSAPRTSSEFHAKAQFIRISSAGLRESHVHDVTITRESPNYPSRRVTADSRQARSAGGAAGRRAEGERFPHRGDARPAAGAGRDAAAHAVAVARSLHARADERCAVLRHAGRHRPGDGGPHRQRGRGVEPRRLCRGRHRAQPERLADPRRLRRQAGCARSIRRWRRCRPRSACSACRA